MRCLVLDSTAQSNERSEGGQIKVTTEVTAGPNRCCSRPRNRGEKEKAVLRPSAFRVAPGEEAPFDAFAVRVSRAMHQTQRAGDALYCKVCDAKLCGAEIATGIFSYRREAVLNKEKVVSAEQNDLASSAPI